MLRKLFAKLRLARPLDQDTFNQASSDEANTEKPTLEVILIDDSELAVIGENTEVESYLFQLAEYNQGKLFEVNRLVSRSAIVKVANAAEEAVELSRNRHVGLS